MRRTRWALYLWPGLPGLWLRGNRAALAVALAAAALLNLALVGSFGYSDWIPPTWLALLWLAIAATWTVAATLSWAGRRGEGSPEAAGGSTNGYEKALEQYLKGDWFQAERLLVGLLRRDADDADARLALATLLRRTGRLDEAAAQLDRLARLDGAAKWEWELRRERELLSRAATRTDEGNTDGAKQSGRTTNDSPAGVTHAA